MVICPLTDGYVSPARYRSKAENQRVVPTWNDEVVSTHRCPAEVEAEQDAA